jgi:DNA invertase Pin-like site-specific DNA recombinase
MIDRELITPAVAYLRGTRGSDTPQRDRIATFAKRTNYEVLAEFWDAIPEREDRIESRPGLAAALTYIEVNGAQTILVASIDHFAKDQIVQEVAMAKAREYGLELIAVDEAAITRERAQLRELVREVLGVGAMLETALRAAHLRAIGECARMNSRRRWFWRSNGSIRQAKRRAPA